MKMKAVDVNHVSRVSEGRLNVAVFENAIPHTIGSGLFMEQALIL